jgi:hypothetical protein
MSRLFSRRCMVIHVVIPVHGLFILGRDYLKMAGGIYLFVGKI